MPCHLIDQVVTSIKAENIMELNKDKIKKKKHCSVNTRAGQSKSSKKKKQNQR